MKGMTNISSISQKWVREPSPDPPGGWDHTTNMDNIMSQSLSGNQNSGKSISVPQFKTLERNYNNGILNTKTAIYKIPQLDLLRYSKYNIPGLYIKWSKRLNK